MDTEREPAPRFLRKTRGNNQRQFSARGHGSPAARGGECFKVHVPRYQQRVFRALWSGSAADSRLPSSATRAVGTGTELARNHRFDLLRTRLGDGRWRLEGQLQAASESVERRSGHAAKLCPDGVPNGLATGF